MRTILAALLFLVAAPLRAQEQARFAIEKWCGVNKFLPSSRIEACEAQAAENVLTERGKWEKFFGATQLSSATLAGYPIKGLWQFVAPSGTKYLIVHASQTIYQTNLSSAPVAIGTTSANGVVDAQQAFNKIYFVDGASSSWYWDGTSTAAVAGMPICKYIEFKDERLYCGNTSVSTSRLDVSSAGGAGYWTVPANLANNPDAPNTFNFQQQDGDSINCMKSTPWGIFVGKGRSSHMLKGYNNDTYYKILISPNIGCVDDRSVQVVDGSLVWLSYEGIYAYSGSGAPELISKKIEPDVKAIRVLTAQLDSWRVTSQDDWNLGTITTNGPSDSWSTSISPGDIVPSSWTAVDTSSSDFAAGTGASGLTIFTTTGAVQLSTSAFKIYNGDFETGNFTYWSCSLNIGSGGDYLCGEVAGSLAIEGSYGTRVLAGCDSVSAPTGRVEIRDGLSNAVLYTSTYANDTQTVTGKTVNLETLGISTRTLTIVFTADNGSNRAQLTSSTFTAISSITWSGEVQSNCSPSGYFGWGKLDSIRINRYFSLYQSSITPQSFTSQIFDTHFSTPVGGLLSISSSVPTGTGIATSVRSCRNSTPDSTCTAWAAVTNAQRIDNQQNRYYQYISSFTSSVGTSTALGFSFQLEAYSTGTYTSPVEFIGTDITSWHELHFGETATQSGVLTYQVRAATYSFAASATSPSWTTISNHATLTISTGSYVQYRVTSGFTEMSSTMTVKDDSSLLEWAEGTAPPVASLFHDHRYWLCTTTASVKNDACFVLQKNNEWTYFTAKGAGALTLYDNKPTLGSADTDSLTYRIMQESEKNFAGSAIRSYWTGPDFFVPDQDSTLRELWFEADPSTSTTITIGYAVDKSTTVTSRLVNLGRSTSFVEEKIPILAGFAKGKYLRYQIENNNASEAPVVHRLTSYANIEPRKY